MSRKHQNIKAQDRGPARPAGTSTGAGRIELAEFQEARKDPRVRGFLSEARAYGARLQREQRNH